MITKKKKKKKILNLEPKYQVDMTAQEKYMRAAILSGGDGIFFFHLYVYRVVPLSGACEMGLCFLMRGITSLPERGDLDVRD